MCRFGSIISPVGGKICGIGGGIVSSTCHSPFLGEYNLYFLLSHREILAEIIIPAPVSPCGVNREFVMSDYEARANIRAEDCSSAWQLMRMTN